MYDVREPITISLESEMIVKIDDSRGKNEPRSRFIEDIISEFLDKKEKPTSKHDPEGEFPS